MSKHRLKGLTMDTVTMAIMAIGGIALMPLAIAAIGGIIRHRRASRRAAMFNRFNDRMGI
jgi:hypothetical protein